MDYKKIKTLLDVVHISKASSSADGETIHFELKGTAHRESFDASDKNRLAKEISAFANTYGGIICFHYGKDGEDDVVQPFPNDFAIKNIGSVEGWLHNSLEPQLRGLDVVEIEGVIIINVPESDTKPHRSAREKNQYFYRHGTQSQPMPEIMISSMYRSQTVFSYTPSVTAKFLDNWFGFTINVRNNSTLSGSIPRFDLYVWTSERAVGFTIKENADFESAMQFHLDGVQNSVPSRPQVFTTKKEFSSKLLYPKDRLWIRIEGNQRHMLDGSKYALVQLDTYFKESAPKKVVKLYDIRANKLLECSSQLPVEQLFFRYADLIKSAE